MNLPPVTIAILNWNNADALPACIESVQRQTYPAVELRLLDNASTDGSSDLLRQRYPHLPLTVYETNLGFARAHNHAIRQSQTPYYMPLNPDVILTPTYVAEMVRVAELHPRVGSVAGKLRFMRPDGTPTDRLYSTGHLLTRSRAPANRGYTVRDSGQYQRVEAVFAANGAAPLYRRAMLDDVALEGTSFCEDFFLYGEDHDLGWRARLRGWACLYTPYALGYHAGYGSGGIRSFRVQVQFTRNRYLTLARNDHFAYLLADLPAMLLYEAIWQLSRLLKGTPGRLPAHWCGLAAALAALPRTLRARASIQQRRTVSPHALRAFTVAQLW